MLDNWTEDLEKDSIPKIVTDIPGPNSIKLIDEAEINTLTVVTMQVPCCTGLLLLAKKAVEEAQRNIPIKHIMVSIKGEILKDELI